MRRAAAIEERLLVPAYASRWSSLSVAAHRVLAFPLQLRGPARRRIVASGEREVALFELGRPKLTEPLCARLFGELPPAESEASRFLGDPAELAGTGADLVVAEVHRWIAPRFRRAGWLIVPDQVRWQGELSALPPLAPPHSLKDDLRKMRSQGYTLEHATSPADWEEFASTIVQPHANARFGSDAWIPSPYLWRRFAERGQLHFVVRNGVRVGGFCVLRSGDTAWLPLSGVRHGDPALLRAGVSVAAYVLAFDWARRQGCTRIDLGRTSSFLRDGVQQYKRKWGLDPVPDPLAHLMAVWVGSEAARLAFAREPVLIERQTGLWLYAGREV
jgi:GNAT acetyltransferase-like protein